MTGKSSSSPSYDMRDIPPHLLGRLSHQAQILCRLHCVGVKEEIFFVGESIFLIEDMSRFFKSNS